MPNIDETTLRAIVDRIRRIPNPSLSGSSADRIRIEDGFWAKITAVDSGGKHSWERMKFDATLSDFFSQYDPPVVGQANALKVGGGSAAIGQIVWMRLGGMFSGGSEPEVYHVFQADVGTVIFRVDSHDSAAGEYIGQIISPYQSAARAILSDEVSYGTHVIPIGAVRGGLVIGQESDGAGGTRQIVTLVRETQMLSSAWGIITGGGDGIYYGTISTLPQAFASPGDVSGALPGASPAVIYNCAESEGVGSQLGIGSVVCGTIIGNIDANSQLMGGAYVLAVFAPNKQNYIGDGQWIEVEEIGSSDEDYDSSDPTKKRIAHQGSGTAVETSDPISGISFIEENGETKIRVTSRILGIDETGHLAGSSGTIDHDAVMDGLSDKYVAMSDADTPGYLPAKILAGDGINFDISTTSITVKQAPIGASSWSVNFSGVSGGSNGTLNIYPLMLDSFGRVVGVGGTPDVSVPVGGVDQTEWIQTLENRVTYLESQVTALIARLDAFGQTSVPTTFSSSCDESGSITNYPGSYVTVLTP